VAKPTVTVVVPVYGDWPSLNECIESLNEHLDTRHSVLLVNDCGPDVDLMEKHIKQAIQGHPNFTYYRNDQNLGFIGTCNRAVLELDTTNNDILLLNSDTQVTAGFAEEMLKVLYASGQIGIVSPRSNNATLATVPLWAAAQKGIDSKDSYKLFVKFKQQFPKYSIVPVAHGFCMLIRRSLIRKYGLFDPAFGKGYGEEVDFCMRIKEHGYLSVLSNHSYVFHLEARSFTLATKKKLLERNNKIINKRYPDYSNKIIPNYFRQALIEEESIYPPVAPKKPTTSSASEIVKKVLRKNHTLYTAVRKAHSALRNNRR
jgi:GT2 family glycosyltransferase